MQPIPHVLVFLLSLEGLPPERPEVCLPRSIRHDSKSIARPSAHQESRYVDFLHDGAESFSHCLVPRIHNPEGRSRCEVDRQLASGKGRARLVL